MQSLRKEPLDHCIEQSILLEEEERNESNGEDADEHRSGDIDYRGEGVVDGIVINKVLQRRDNRFRQRELGYGQSKKALQVSQTVYGCFRYVSLI